MKQTAVEWLEFRYKNNITLNQYDFEQAKEMEAKHIENAYDENENYMCDGTEAEQYYNGKFKNK
jgi:hypothetical protein